MRPEYQIISKLPEYQEADRRLRVQHLIIGCILTLIFVPAGVSLDYFVYPGLLQPIFKARIVCDFFLLPIFIMLFTKWGRRCVYVLCLVWPLLPVILVSWMIWMTEGAVSPYYAGLNLMIIVACFMLPYTFWEATSYCALVLASYLTACFLHQKTPTDPSLLFNNLYFMTITCIICVIACHFLNIRRINDFKLRHELAIRNDQLAELDRMKSDFFANISHELRTPLTLILSPVEYLLQTQSKDAIPSNIRSVLEMVEKNAMRLLRHINDLLEIVRMEEKHTAIKKEPMDLSLIVSGIVDSVRHLAGSKKLRIETEVKTDSLVIYGDQNRLEKVFLNLLTNAVKFTESGGVIRVKCVRDGNHALVSVQDTGIGIPTHELPHIFDRFKQVDGSSTRRHQGLGLGLAIARESIEEHGGQLSVDSKLNQGATFLVRIPLESDAPSSMNAPKLKKSSDPLDLIHLRAERAVLQEDSVFEEDFPEIGQGEHRVLVVDDEPDMRRFLVSTLAQDHRVLQASNGESGLRVAMKELPDLAVLDLMLPGVNGLDVCRLLRSDKRTENIKIVLLTARADEASKIEGLRRGADDFLTKPFASIEIKTRLNNLLRTFDLEKNLRHRNDQLKETITKLKSTESQLIHSEKMNALGGLAAGLLHEVNNPLNYTMTALQLFEQSLNECRPDWREILQDMNEGMNRIKTIVSDLRSFAHPDPGDRMAPFYPAEAVEMAMRFTAHLRNDVAIQVDFDHDCMAFGSKTHIVQVLVNLIKNAHHATDLLNDDRTPKITISGKRDGNRLRINVWDNGVGMDEETISKAFNPFFTTRDVGEGMGLGLSICDTIVRKHHGSIKIASRVDEWTEVSFDIPTEDIEEQP